MTIKTQTKQFSGSSALQKRKLYRNVVFYIKRSSPAELCLNAEFLDPTRILLPWRLTGRGIHPSINTFRVYRWHSVFFSSLPNMCMLDIWKECVKYLYLFLNMTHPGGRLGFSLCTEHLKTRLRRTNEDYVSQQHHRRVERHADLNTLTATETHWDTQTMASFFVFFTDFLFKDGDDVNKRFI